MELLAGEPDYLVEHVCWFTILANSANFTKFVFSMNQNAPSSSILVLFTGILDWVQNITDW
jgi:hypothetical protein